MKKLNTILILLFALLFSCDNKDSFDSDFLKSLRAWENAKKTQGNNYEYISESSSVFGFGSSTQITVSNGVVVSRSYERYTLSENTREKIVTDSWTENSSELNTHEEGAPILSIDEIYFRCKNEILSVNKDQNYISFRAENQGLLSSCTYFPKNCADDCAVGFVITSIQWKD